MEIDLALTSEKGGFARDVSSRLSVADDVKNIGPDLVVGHAQKVVKDRTGREAEIKAINKKGTPA